MLRYLGIVILAASVVAIGATMKQANNENNTIPIYNAATGKVENVKRVIKTDAEWKTSLTPEQYRITRLKGTESPNTTCSISGGHTGIFQCVCCGTDLFKVGAKFDSGTGWPSFWEPVSKLNVRYESDDTHGMQRTEVQCARCDAHLGHVFDDGPPPTGKRYCMNAAALKLVELKPEAKYEKSTFAAGCFWGVESAFRHLLGKGVKSTRVGYTGGHLKNPTYQDVCSDKTGHGEAVEVEYDPKQVSYEELLKAFWSTHDPTTLNRQGPDHGSQYRSVIFYHTPEQRALAEKSKLEFEKSGRFKSPIVTEIAPAGEFYPAEDYHQQYNEKRGKDSCGM